ncbi:YxeA family protein [Staphylococcus xylosus]|uniref:YxeA family protein n=1 Tax=Staphylococcus TaxID=1279 RepID=UPI000E6964CC|nr:YxeA family protein [Staphylococcus xylosus]RIM75464.1 YxeA family protein [Staphylococcus xylosus]
MKKIFNLSLISIIILVIIFSILFVFLERKTEGIEAFKDNFLTNKDVKAYYTISNDGEKKGDKYLYTFDGYDKKGDKQIIRKLIDKKLKKQAYIKIYAKGSQGKGWMEIKEKEVPKVSLKKIKE